MLNICTALLIKLYTNFTLYTFYSPSLFITIYCCTGTLLLFLTVACHCYVNVNSN